jgi:diguanylate cyclase (GGDEF)-like protein
MAGEVLRDITRLCLDLDKRSAEIYSHMASLSDKPEFKKFWQQMAAEERMHVKFWKEIAEMADRGILPNVFEDPEKTRRELEDIQAKVNATWDTFRQAPEKASPFLLAYRMEFYLLHPALGTLFHYMKGISTEDNPLDTYEEHLAQLNEMIIRHGSINPEMELLAEVIQALWKRNRELARRSAIDELTDVFNRRGFFDTITPLLHLSQRHQYPVAVMMIDIDDFKHVNDTYGHQAGDKVLKGVASILRNNVRSSDIVGRYGGEEFITFFNDVEREMICGIAETIREKIARKSHDAVTVTVSIGLAQGKIHHYVQDEIIHLIHRADESLYRAKQSGKNMVIMD